MKKLMLPTRHFLAVVTMILIIALNSCRKDRPNIDESKKEQITSSMIDEWYRSNPVSKVLPIDWGKARQGVVDGKHFVMAPTVNVDLMKELITEQTSLKLNKLNSISPIARSNGKVSVGMDPIGDDPSGNNPNYNSSHPPHIYFILDPVSSSMRTYLMNFIPDSEASGFGQGGSWTGKLYEWNTTSDTVLVQQFSNNVLTSRTVSVFPHVDENGGITFSKPKKIQSVKPLKDKQVSGIFGWLADKIMDGLGALGYLFGLTELVPSTSGSTGHHMHYRFISSPSSSDGTSWGNSGESSFQYVTMGLPAISTYLTGIGSGQSYTEVTLSSYNYNGVNAYNGGPNNMVPNAAGIELLEYINVSESAQGYILTMIANPVATVLLEFVNTQGKSPASRDFASWAVEYCFENPSVNAFELLQMENIPNSTIVLPNLIDTAGLSTFPAFKNIVSNLPNFMTEHPEVLKALSRYTGFRDKKIMELMQLGKGPKIELVSNLMDEYGRPCFGRYNPATKILLMKKEMVLGLDKVQSPNRYAAIGMLLTIVTLHEFVHYGRDTNKLTRRVFIAPDWHEAGMVFELSISPPYLYDTIDRNNAIQWVKYFNFNIND